MSDSLLACLMMIVSNGPFLDQKEEKFLLAGIARFKAFKKRVPSMSSVGKRPRRASASKAKSSVLSELSGLENVVFNDFIDDVLDSEDVSEQRASASLPDSVPIESEEECVAREQDGIAALDAVGDWPLRNFNLSEVHCDGGRVTSLSCSSASAASCAGVHGLCGSWAVEDFAGGGGGANKPRCLQENYTGGVKGGFIQATHEGGGFMQRHGTQELGLERTAQRENALERWRELRAPEDLEAREEGGGERRERDGGREFWDGFNFLDASFMQVQAAVPVYLTV
jgi:hypothetical protein